MYPSRRTRRIPHPPRIERDWRKDCILYRGCRYEIEFGGTLRRVAIHNSKQGKVEFEFEHADGTPEHPCVFVIMSVEEFRLAVRREFATLSEEEQRQRGYFDGKV